MKCLLHQGFCRCMLASRVSATVISFCVSGVRNNWEDSGGLPAEQRDYGHDRPTCCRERIQHCSMAKGKMIICHKPSSLASGMTHQAGCAGSRQTAVLFAFLHMHIRQLFLYGGGVIIYIWIYLNIYIYNIHICIMVVSRPGMNVSGRVVKSSSVAMCRKQVEVARSPEIGSVYTHIRSQTPNAYSEMQEPRKCHKTHPTHKLFRVLKHVCQWIRRSGPNLETALWLNSAVAKLSLWNAGTWSQRSRIISAPSASWPLCWTSTIAGDLLSRCGHISTSY